MVLDQELLKKAQAAGSRMAEAEREALLARAEYHTLIRRMHLAGASFREIADALVVSHQRVQQIVDAAGGTWWKRVWRTRNVKRDAVCTFCERPPSEVAKLIAGPNVYICDECVALAEQAVAGHASMRSETRITCAKPRSRARCSFCSKPISKHRPLASAPEASVCADCLRLCREILSDRAAR